MLKFGAEQEGLKLSFVPQKNRFVREEQVVGVLSEGLPDLLPDHEESGDKIGRTEKQNLESILERQARPGAQRAGHIQWQTVGVRRQDGHHLPSHRGAGERGEC